MVEARRAIVNLLFHKDVFLRVGGYDEDYAGHYGKEDTDFFRRLKRAASLVYRDDILIRAVPPTLIKDARTIGRPRDKTRNSRVFLKKMAAGFLRPENPLRFSWEQVL
jgi:hypothetical protein